MEWLALWIADVLIGKSSDFVPRTLLGWARVGLLAGLIAQIVYVIHVWATSSVPTLLWFSILANFVALAVLRHVLRWRYPI
jgi:hypothetical protein